MIRVLQVIGSLHIGGSQSFILNLYKNVDLQKLQFDFVVFEEERTDFYDEIEKLGGKIYVAPQYTVCNHIQFCRWWKNFFKSHPEYQIVHGHVRSVAVLYLYEAKKQGRYTIAHSHSTSNGKGISKIIKTVLQFPLKYMDNYCFACSDEAGKWLFGTKKTHNKQKYAVIANGIDIQNFAFNQKHRDEIRSKWNINEKFVIGNIGRLSAPKNHKFLIDVFASVKQKFPKAHLLLVGDGELKTELVQYCRQKNLMQDVTFAGAQTETNKYYSAMDLFVFPSLWEGLGIALIEAQSSGLTCIVSDAIPQQAVVTDNVTVCSINDTNTHWVQTIIDNTDVCRTSVDISKNPLITKFDITKIAIKMQNFYIQLSEGKENATVSFEAG